jgi:hypothetical protein
VAHPERAGPKARDRTSGPERLGGESGFAEHFECISGGIAERDQLADMSLVGKRGRPARDLDAGIIESAGETIEIGPRCNFPAYTEPGVAASVYN